MERTDVAVLLHPAASPADEPALQVLDDFRQVLAWHGMVDSLLREPLHEGTTTLQVGSRRQHSNAAL